MSRKCPKRNHMFLNWLRSNRTCFLLTPYIVRFRKRRIEFGFQPIAPTLRFCLKFTASGGPWIAVDYMSHGREPEGIIRFYGAEYHTPQGWTSLKLRPEDCRFWPTREEVWTDICFEVFLSWCNEELAPASWLEFFEIGNTTSAHLHKDKPAANATMLSKFVQAYREEANNSRNGTGFMLPVRTSMEKKLRVTM